MTSRMCQWSVVAMALLPAAAAAQTPAPLPVAPSVLTPAYDSGGRRDPFVSLVATTKKDSAPATAAPARRPSGASLASLLVTDVSVKGIMRSGSAMLAILEGPDGRSFVARRQDRLANGAIKSIEFDAVVFAESITDAQGKSRVQDVRRLLHPPIGGGR